VIFWGFKYYLTIESFCFATDCPFGYNLSVQSKYETFSLTICLKVNGDVSRDKKSIEDTQSLTGNTLTENENYR